MCRNDRLSERSVRLHAVRWVGCEDHHGGKKKDGGPRTSSLGGEGGGDIKIEPQAKVAKGSFRISTDLNGSVSMGPECRRRGGDPVTDEKQLRWLQLLRGFDDVVTSAWAIGDASGEFHTRRGRGPRD